MADFNGKPLVFRDDIERAFWGKMVEAEFMRARDGFDRATTTNQADKAVIEMRVRQKTVMWSEGMTARLRCAVCLNPCIEDGKPAPHVDGCPLGPLPKGWDAYSDAGGAIRRGG